MARERNDLASSLGESQVEATKTFSHPQAKEVFDVTYKMPGDRTGTIRIQNPKVNSTKGARHLAEATGIKSENIQNVKHLGRTKKFILEHEDGSATEVRALDEGNAGALAEKHFSQMPGPKKVTAVRFTSAAETRAREVLRRAEEDYANEIGEINSKQVDSAAKISELEVNHREIKEHLENLKEARFKEEEISSDTKRELDKRIKDLETNRTQAEVSILDIEMKALSGDQVFEVSFTTKTNSNPKWQRVFANSEAEVKEVFDQHKERFEFEDSSVEVKDIKTQYENEVGSTNKALENATAELGSADSTGAIQGIISKAGDAISKLRRKGSIKESDEIALGKNQEAFETAREEAMDRLIKDGLSSLDSEWKNKYKITYRHKGADKETVLKLECPGDQVVDYLKDNFSDYIETDYLDIKVESVD